MYSGVLRKRSLNIPETVNNDRTTTPSTLSPCSVRQNQCVQFDLEAIGRTNRHSLLALAYMAPSDHEDDSPATRQRALEDEWEHDLNQLADYKGDSDDEAPDAESVECDIDNTQHDTEGERAVEVRHKG